MTLAHGTRMRLATAALGVTVAVSGLLLFWLLRPYDAVRFVGEPGVATPAVVEAGGTVTITREAFCNDGVDVTVRRWADAMSDDGRVLASFDIGTVEFYSDGVPFCSAPSVSGVTLPNYIIGADGAAGMFRLRFSVEYQANPVRTVAVESVTTSFLITPPES
jgi:hypothetical protein